MVSKPGAVALTVLYPRFHAPRGSPDETQSSHMNFDKFKQYADRVELLGLTCATVLSVVTGHVHDDLPGEGHGHTPVRPAWALSGTSTSTGTATFTSTAISS